MYHITKTNLKYRCSSELAKLVPLPYSQRRSILYFDRLHDFSVAIPRCILFPPE